MRNLKRALSLTLASVMLLGMMVLGTSAAGYPDVDDNDNVEAIEVLQAIGVMTGSNSGNFNPDSKVSRIEMAIVMANLLDLDVDYFQGQNTFSDVPEWASGYVNACAASGIVTGVGGGRFGTGNVTATQAALMMMKALGYFQYNSDFGSDWARATALQAAKINLFDGLKVQDNTQLTRNQVAQLALNTLQATMVDADDNTLSITTPDGVTVAGGNVKYVVRASNDTKISGSINRTEVSGSSTSGINGWTIELGEQLYSGDLKRIDGYDDFDRPANVWSYKSNEIGSYANDITFSYTAAVSERDLYNDIGKNALDNYGWSVSVDGNDVTKTTAKPDRNKSDDWGASAKGVLTQVFVNAKDERVTVTCIHSYAGEITRVVDNDDTATVTIRQYAPSAKDGDGNLKYINPQAGNRTYETTNGTFAVGDIVIYTAANNEVQSVVKATPVEGTVAAYKAGSNAKLDDKTYSYAKMIASNLEDSNEDNPSLNDKYIFYVDANDYLIAFKGVDTIDEYLYVVKAQDSVTGVDAKVVLSDGSEKVIKINEVKAGSTKADATETGSYGDPGVVTEGDVYSYEVSDDVYTLTALRTFTGTGVKEGDYTKPITVSAAGKTDVTKDEYTAQGPDGDPYAYSGKWYKIKRDSAKMTGEIATKDKDGNNIADANLSTAMADVTVTNNTVFVDVKDNLVYTGYRAVVDYDKANAAVVYDKNGRAEIIFITDNKSSGVEADFFFLKSGKPVNTKSGTTNYYTYEAWIDGEKTEVVTKGDLSASNDGMLVSNALYKIEKKNSSNEVTQIKQVGSAWTNTGILATNCATVKDGYALTLKATSSNLVGGAAAGKTTFRYNDDTIFVVIEPKNGKGTVLDALNVYRGADSDIVVEDTGDTTNRTAVYVIDAGDKSEDTPMAKLVYVYKPAAVGTIVSGGSANDSTSKDGMTIIYSVADPTKMPDAETILEKALDELNATFNVSRGDTFEQDDATHYSLRINGRNWTILLETGSKQVTAQPTNITKVTEILNRDGSAWVPMAPVISTGITQTVTPQTDGSVKVTLSGSVKKVTDTSVVSADELKAALKVFANDENKETATFEALYDLKAGKWGFVVVELNGNVYELLVGERLGSPTHTDSQGVWVGGNSGIVQRHNGATDTNGDYGAVKFVNSRTFTVGGITYTLDVSGLTYPS